MRTLRKSRGRYSHSGCINCKRGGIKCDETFGGCLACRRKQIECEYENKIFVYQPGEAAQRKKKFKKVKINSLEQKTPREKLVSASVPESVCSFEVIDEFIDRFKENFDEGKQSERSENIENVALETSDNIQKAAHECKTLDEISKGTALLVPKYVQYWRPYSSQRYNELAKKLDPVGLETKNVHYHEYDPEVQEFIFHAFIHSKAVYNYVLGPVDETNCIAKWFIYFGKKYAIMGFVLNFITCNLLNIRCSDDRWCCILKRNMVASLANLSARINKCDSFAEVACYLFSIMFLFSEQTASRVDIWRLHLKGAFTILEQCGTFYNRISQDINMLDPEMKLALQMFSFSKNWFVCSETLACLSAPNGGVIEDIDRLRYHLSYNTQYPDDGVLLGGFNLMKGYSQRLVPILVEIITFITAFKKSDGICLSGTQGILENLQPSEEQRILGEKLLDSVRRIQSEEFNLLSMKNYVNRAYIRACHICFCSAIRIYILSVFLGDFIYGSDVQHCVQTIEEQLVTIQDIGMYGLSIHWPLFVASLCAPSGEQRLTFIKALKSISNNGTFVARNTVERVERFWKVIDSGGLIEEKDYDCTVA